MSGITGELLNIAKAACKVVAGEDGAAKFSQAMKGVSSSGIKGVAANIAGFNLSSDMAITASKNADNAAAIASRLGIEIEEGANASTAIAQGISKMGKETGGYDKVATTIRDMVNGGELSDISDDVINAYQKKMSHYGGAVGGSDIDLAELMGREGKKNGGVRAFTSGFFGDAEYGRTRKIMAGGAYVGGALGLRVLSGGDLTHNSRGENDIAGIPFF